MYMMKYNLMILLLLLISPMMVLSMNSWLNIWMNMELNLIMFIIYVIMNNKYIYDISMKYFLINAFSSSIFILLINMNLFFSSDLLMYIMNLSILLKLGSAPFHFWFINMMIELNWMSCLILSTLQKLIPLIILNYIYKYNVILLSLIISGLFSILMGFNQNNLKKILAYSSLNHLSWMLISLMISNYMMLIYFISYSIINLSLMMMFNMLNIMYMNDLFKYKNMLMYFIINFLSLGGLPPFFGFLSKWYSMIEIIYKLNLLIMLLLLFYSLNFMYFYIRLLYSIMILKFYNLKFFKNFFYLKFNMKMLMLMKLISISNLMMMKFWIFL